MNQAFFTEFLMVSTWQTVILIVLLLITFAVIFYLAKKGVSFSARVLAAMVLALMLGLTMQAWSGFTSAPQEITYINEATTWFGLFGNGFMNLIKMLVIPLVLVSIVHVIINMEKGANIGKLVRNTLIITMGMVAVASIVGLVFGVIFGVGQGAGTVAGLAEAKEVTSIAQTFTNLIPENPVEAMVNMNVIGLVIFAAFVGFGARKLYGQENAKKSLKFFNRGVRSLHQVVTSVALAIIKLIPYAVIPLLANTLALHGLSSVIEVGKFILALYLAIAFMFVLQLLQLVFCGLNPLRYIRKAVQVLILAFTSRSSIGVLPVTIQTLTSKLGVSQSTANFVASFGTTAGMQGCAGVFPAIILVYIAHMNGIAIDATFVVMTVFIVTLGSLGIAGIPGTATMAASVSLTGMGMAKFFPAISPILAIDPLIDMGRTLLNVSGSMVNAITVDKSLGRLDFNGFNQKELAIIDSDRVDYGVKD